MRPDTEALETQALASVGIFLTAAVLFLLSMCMSWTEIKYLVWAKSAQATTMGTHFEKTRDRNHIEHVRQVQEYTFLDQGILRREADEVPLNWAEPVSGQVRVEYISGKPSESRIVGLHRLALLWVVAFFGSIAVMAWKIYRICREAYQ